MKNRYFQNKAEAIDHAAHMVATFWLKSAQRIISRQTIQETIDGEKPEKLSRQSLVLSQAELDRPIYDGCRPEVHEVAGRCVETAIGIMNSGMYQDVAWHFKAGMKGQS